MKKEVEAKSGKYGEEELLKNEKEKLEKMENRGEVRERKGRE